MLSIILLLSTIYYCKPENHILILMLLVCCLLFKHNKLEQFDFIDDVNLLKNTNFYESNIINTPKNIYKIINSDNIEEKKKLKYTCELNKYITTTKNKNPWNLNSQYIDTKSIDFVDSEYLYDKYNIVTSNVKKALLCNIITDKAYIYSYNANLKNIKKDNWYIISLDTVTISNKDVLITPYISTTLDNENEMEYDFFGFKYKKVNNNNKFNKLSWVIFVTPENERELNSLNFYIHNSSNTTCILDNPTIKHIPDIDKYLQSIYPTTNKIGYQMIDPNKKLKGSHGICTFPITYNGKVYNECINEEIDGQQYSWCRLQDKSKSYCKAPQDKLLIPNKKSACRVVSEKYDVDPEIDEEIDEENYEYITEEVEIDGENIDGENIDNNSVVIRKRVPKNIKVNPKNMKYVNNEILHLVRLIYLEDNKDPDNYKEYVDYLLDVIIQVTPEQFDQYIKELTFPIIHKTDSCNTNLRRLIAHNIKLFNKLHPDNEFELEKIEDLINKLKVVKPDKTNETKSNSLLDLKKDEPNYDKIVHSIINDIGNLYITVANSGSNAPVDQLIDIILNKNKELFNSFAVHVDYKNLVDIVKNGMNYEHISWDIESFNNSSVYKKWKNIVKMQDMNINVAILKNDQINNDNISLEFDNFLYHSIFFTINILTRIVNEINDTQLLQNFELSEKEPGINLSLINKVNKLVLSSIKPLISSTIYQQIFKQRSLQIMSQNEIQTEIPVVLSDDEIAENNENINIINQGLDSSFEENEQIPMQIKQGSQSQFGSELLEPIIDSKLLKPTIDSKLDLDETF
jgi:hypothetical protein